MALLESIITVGCIGLSGVSNQACTKALEAGAVQGGVDKLVHRYENHQTRHFEKIATNLFGKDAMATAGGLVWIAKSLSDRRATFGLPNFGICNKLSTEIEQNTTKLVLQWKF